MDNPKCIVAVTLIYGIISTTGAFATLSHCRDLVTKLKEEVFIVGHAACWYSLVLRGFSWTHLADARLDGRDLALWAAIAAAPG